MSDGKLTDETLLKIVEKIVKHYNKYMINVIKKLDIEYNLEKIDAERLVHNSLINLIGSFVTNSICKEQFECDRFVRRHARALLEHFEEKRKLMIE